MSQSLIDLILSNFTFYWSNIILKAKTWTNLRKMWKDTLSWVSESPTYISLILAGLFSNCLSFHVKLFQLNMVIGPHLIWNYFPLDCFQSLVSTLCAELCTLKCISCNESLWTSFATSVNGSELYFRNDICDVFLNFLYYCVSCVTQTCV